QKTPEEKMQNARNRTPNLGARPRTHKSRSTGRPEIGVVRNPTFRPGFFERNSLPALEAILAARRCRLLIRPCRNSIVRRVFAFAPLGGQISYTWPNVPALSASLVLNSIPMDTNRRYGWLVLALFFCSGATALIYEVVWSKYLSQMFGSTIYAQTVVLAVFMGGLALGNRIFGGRSDALRQPLRAYGYIEI